MDLFSVLTLLGGLAIFLFGMNVMGGSLEKCGGNRMKSILESMTQSPLRGALLGLAVTAVIQSSSATTVMVVGFVNSGLMQLGQSIPIIMGANIGTTVTAWLLSLTGIESDSLFITLLKPSSFSPALAFIGIAMTMFSKKPHKKDAGNVMLGFAVLIAGMDMMTGSVAGLKDSETFTGLFTLFTNPVLGVLAGALLTAIIQSSSASVGILQALSTTGSITYSSAVPIILGQNIGTCATALLSSIGTNKNARRSAIVHLCFNVINTALFMFLFYTLNAVFKFSFYDSSINAAGIATMHSIFNIFGTVVLLPFTKQLEKIAYLLIPEDDKKDKTLLLDERLLATPSVAITQAEKIAVQMAEIARESIKNALSLTEKYDKDLIEKVYSDEETVDKYEDVLGTYLVKLCRENLTVEDSHRISNLLHCIGDFERISDHAVNLCETAEEMHDKSITFSAEALHEISVISNALNEILDLTCDAFSSGNLSTAKNIEPLEETIDNLRTKLKENHVKRLKNGECTIEHGFVFSDFLVNCERVGDHCSNIAVCMLEIAHDSFETHGHFTHIKDKDKDEFSLLCEFYSKKYAL